MQPNIVKLIDAVSSDNKEVTADLFGKIIREKVNNVLDIKRIAITSDIYNKGK